MTKDQQEELLSCGYAKVQVMYNMDATIPLKIKIVSNNSDAFEYEEEDPRTALQKIITKK